MKNKLKDYEKITGFVGVEELEDVVLDMQDNGGALKEIPVTASVILPTAVCSLQCEKYI